MSASPSEELERVKRQLEELYKDAEDIGAGFVWPAMSRDAALAKIYAEREKIVESIERQRSTEDSPFLDPIPTSAPDVFFAEGPYILTDSQPDPGDPLSSLPPGSYTYNFYATHDVLSGNQMALPTVTVDIYVAKNAEAGTHGFIYDGTFYPTLHHIMKAEYAHDAIPVINTPKQERISPILAEIDPLEESRDDLEQQIASVQKIDLVIVRGDSSLTIYSGPGTILPDASVLGGDGGAAAAAAAASTSPTLADYLAHFGVASPARARIVVWDGDSYFILSPSMDYVEFVKRMAALPTDSPNVQIIEPGYCHTDRPEKKKRMRAAITQEDVTHADIVYRLDAASFAQAEQLAVYQLSDKSGLIVANTETHVPYCGHIHDCAITDLSRAQFITGKPCHKCA